RFLPETAAPLALVIYACVAGILGLVLLKVMKNLSIYITTHTKASDAFVANLKADTLNVLPILLFVIGAGVLVLLVLEMRRKTLIDDEPRGFLARIDPERQHLLFSLLTTPWMYWFFAAFAGCTVFLVLFTVVFTNAPAGIADGIWQGLYYWLQQQQVARGGQPWYYYLLLIPLYEQVGLVFGLAGIVYSLFRPTRFRLFLSYWALGNLFIYSWAAEKMPWLMIHIMLPLLLLAAVILSPLLKRTWALILDLRDRSRSAPATEGEATGVQPRWSSRERVRTGAAVFGVVVAVLLLLPTVHNMYEVSYVHAADGPHEMMVYVQTTTDVNTVMGKVDLLDQKLVGGTHQLKIGLTDDATWPFAWYLRDYPNTCFKFPEGCPAMAKDVQVIITGGDSLPQSELTYTTSVNGVVPYSFHTYKLRSWWDEGYKTGNGNAVAGSVGPWLWLSYGDNPPKGASFNPVLAAQNVWNWWWERRAIGGTDGAYEMGLFIRKGLGVSP
ncbi:MAG TPA: hypothetical protein VFN23_02835, partial [Ktedonobacteraceae bacterium]|nr:hypothetical protein [Ktedonobacteraceae bacterium]